MQKVKNHPGIYRRGSRYVATWRDPEGHLRKQSAKTIAEADAIRSEKKTDKNRNEYTSQSKVTVLEYAQAWIASYSGRTERGINADSLRDYRKALGLDGEGEPLSGKDGTPVGFVGFAGRLQMSAVTPVLIRRYVETLSKRGLSRNTMRLALAPVKAMFADAVEEGTVRWNPTAKVRTSVGPVDDQEDEEEAKALTREQLDALFEQLPAYWLPFFEFLAEYGLRFGEAVELRWKDIEVEEGDIIGGILHVDRRFYRGGVAKPKGRKTRTLRLEAGRARTLHAARRAAGDLVFVAEKGGRIEASNLMGRVLRGRLRMSFAAF